MSNGDQSSCPTPVDTTIKTTTTAIGPADHPTDVSWDILSDYFHESENLFETGWGCPTWIAIPLALVGIAPSVALFALVKVILIILKPFLPAFAGVVFLTLDSIRKDLDPEFASLAVSTLNELLGTDFSPAHLPQGEDLAAHLARAEEIGLMFHRQLLSEFLTSTGVVLQPGGPQYPEPTAATGAGEKITPTSGVRAAARFSGLAINFGTATGIIATIGGLVPEVHLDEIREIGEQVAKNLGLGRLQRLALAPIVQILLAEPYKWFINELARPTQFGLGEVVNPFSGAVMPAELIWRDLARAGYSDDKIQAVLELHRKKLSEADLSTLFSAGHIDQPTLQKSIQRLGYSLEDAQQKAEVDRLDKVRPYFDELRSAAVSAYADRHIERDELQGIVNGLPLSTEEKAYIMLAADYKRKVPTKHLTLAELNSALGQGIIDLQEYFDHLTLQGYSDDDQSILLLLELAKLDLAKQKAAASAARAAATAAKKAGGSASPLPTPPQLTG